MILICIRNIEITDLTDIVIEHVDNMLLIIGDALITLLKEEENLIIQQFNDLVTEFAQLLEPNQL
jgi:hypothetical protein